jgi:hypothetical protein
LIVSASPAVRYRPTRHYRILYREQGSRTQHVWALECNLCKQPDLYIVRREDFPVPVASDRLEQMTQRMFEHLDKIHAREPQEDATLTADS